MSEIEVGRCEICREEKQLQRKTFYYGIKCECHSPEHFETVSHCKDCTPVEPFETRISLKTEDLKSLLESPVKKLIVELKEDKSEGSYYYSWQSNIAMSIKDNIKGISHEDANKAAKAFLELLIK